MKSYWAIRSDPYQLLTAHLKSGEVFHFTTQEFMNFNRHNELHRLNGPALHSPQEEDYAEYWINGVPLTFEAFEEIINMSLELKLTDPREWVRDAYTKESKS